MSDAAAIFSSLDQNEDGELSPEELATELLSRGVDEEQVSELFAKLDTNANGRISLAEFTQGYNHYIAAAEEEKKE